LNPVLNPEALLQVQNSLRIDCLCFDATLFQNRISRFFFILYRFQGSSPSRASTLSLTAQLLYDVIRRLSTPFSQFFTLFCVSGHLAFHAGRRLTHLPASLRGGFKQLCAQSLSSNAASSCLAPHPRPASLRSRTTFSPALRAWVTLGLCPKPHKGRRPLTPQGISSLDPSSLRGGFKSLYIIHYYSFK